MQRWDLLTLLCLLFTALVTPVEVAFLTTKLNALFIINRVVDAVFVVVSGWAHGLHHALLVLLGKIGFWSPLPLPLPVAGVPHTTPQDFFVNCLTAHYDEQRGLWVYKLEEMLRAYVLRGWFAVDLVR